MKYVVFQKNQFQQIEHKILISRFTLFVLVFWGVGEGVVEGSEDKEWKPRNGQYEFSRMLSSALFL